MKVSITFEDVPIELLAGILQAFPVDGKATVVSHRHKTEKPVTTPDPEPHTPPPLYDDNGNLILHPDTQKEFGLETTKRQRRSGGLDVNVLRDLAGKGMPYQDIAKKMGARETSVYNALIRENIPFARRFKH